MRISGVVLLVLSACGTPVPAIDAGGPGYDGYDGGCTPDLCPALPSFELPGYNTGLAGVIWGGARGVTLVTQGGNSWPQLAWTDGGSWTNAILPTVGDSIGPVSVAVLSPTDYFVGISVSANHFVDDRLVESEPRDSTAAVRVSNDEVWFAGRSDVLVRWRRDAGFAHVPDTDAGITWSALVDLPDGGILRGDLAGGITAGSQRTQLFPYPVLHLFRAGDTFFATGVDGYDGGGALMWSRPDAGWAAMPGYPLMGAPRTVWASGPTDVWVGARKGQVARFDGSSWHTLDPVPGLRPDVIVNVISGSGDLLVIGGAIDRGGFGADNDAFATVVRRR